MVHAFRDDTENSKAYRDPTPISTGGEQAESLLGTPASVQLGTGPSHWEIFSRLCEESGGKGNHAADAYHAALTIESRATRVTTVGDYARFKNARYAHPLR